MKEQTFMTGKIMAPSEVNNRKQNLCQGIFHTQWWVKGHFLYCTLYLR